MRKILMRICLGVVVPGGPCDLKVSTAIRDDETVATIEKVRGLLRSPERLAASVSLREAVFGVALECSAQCGHGTVG